MNQNCRLPLLKPKEATPVVTFLNTSHFNFSFCEFICLTYVTKRFADTKSKAFLWNNHVVLFFVTPVIARAYLLFPNTIIPYPSQILPLSICA